MLFSIGALAAFLSGEFWPALGLGLFSVLGLYIVLSAGSFDINNVALSHKSSFGEWQICWDEISSVEVGEMDGTLVLHGNRKRFVLSPPDSWSGPDKDEAVTYVLSQFKLRNLSPRQSRSAAYKIMKNTRIR